MTIHAQHVSKSLITLDSDYVLNHAGGDPELLVQLCRAFLDELPLRLENLRRAFAGGDLHRAGRALLQLQSSIIVFGFGHASSTAQSLEASIRSRSRRSVQREWLCLEDQLSALVPQVQRLMLELSTPTTRIQ
jgi:HPt (histidine-containing phosphotransfer) domain-containing protein